MLSGCRVTIPDSYRPIAANADSFQVTREVTERAEVDDACALRSPKRMKTVVRVADVGISNNDGTVQADAVSRRVCASKGSEVLEATGSGPTERVRFAWRLFRAPTADNRPVSVRVRSRRIQSGREPSEVLQASCRRPPERMSLVWVSCSGSSGDYASHHREA